MFGQFVRAGVLTRSPRALWGSRVSKAVSVQSGCTITQSKLIGDISLGEGVNCYKSQVLGPVTIGRFSYLSGPRIDVIAHLNPISIGNFCSIARGVQIQEYNHQTGNLSTAFLSKRINPSCGLDSDEIESRGSIEIGHDVWIGANSIITSGVTIGTGAVVAAGAVVTRDVPPYTIIAGVPAKAMRPRFKDANLVENLLQSQWWTWDLKDIYAYAQEFQKAKHAV